MADIEILQRQFEEAAEQYPGLRHTIVQRSKEGLAPEATALEYEYRNIDSDAAYYVYRWSEYIDGEPNETGYPSWHFLSRPSPHGWNVRHAEGRALGLAEEAGKYLIALPELEGLTIDDSAERWFLALHKVYPCERITYVPPETEFDPNIPRYKLSGSWREAKPGEAYIEELDNVFLNSAKLCGKLLASHAKRRRIKRIIGWILTYIISPIIVAIVAAVIVGIFYDFGWLQSIKEFIYNLIFPK